MLRNGFIIHFVISLKVDRPYKATVVYNLATVVYSDIPRQTVVYQLYTTARGFDVVHAKCYIIYISCMIVCIYLRTLYLTRIRILSMARLTSVHHTSTHIRHTSS